MEKARGERAPTRRSGRNPELRSGGPSGARTIVMARCRTRRGSGGYRGRRSPAFGSSLRLLPRLLPAQRGQVEEVRDEAEVVHTARVGGVGVEGAVAVAEEHAEPVQVEGLVPLPTGAPAASSWALSRKLYSIGALVSSKLTWRS